MKDTESQADKVLLTGIKISETCITADASTKAIFFGKKYTEVEINNSRIEYNVENPSESLFQINVVARD